MVVVVRGVGGNAIERSMLEVKKKKKSRQDTYRNIKQILALIKDERTMCCVTEK